MGGGGGGGDAAAAEEEEGEEEGSSYLSSPKGMMRLCRSLFKPSLCILAPLVQY